MEWRVAEGPPLVAVQREARLDELFIVGHDDPDEPTAFVASQFVETIILEASRPVLAIRRLAPRDRQARHVEWQPRIRQGDPFGGASQSSRRLPTTAHDTTSTESARRSRKEGKASWHSGLNAMPGQPGVRIRSRAATRVVGPIRPPSASRANAASRLREAGQLDFSRAAVDWSSVRAVGAGEKRVKTQRIARDQVPSITFSSTRMESPSVHS